MKRLLVSVLGVAVAASLVIAGCGQAAPAPATAAPAKAAAAPATKVVYPEKGRTITIIVPWGAGGGGDLGARILAPLLEKEIGTTVEVVNKPGAAGQIGATELAKSKPDGYTLGMTHLPATINAYLDVERKATFTKKDFQPIALQVVDPAVVAVKATSPYKSLKDLVDAAKASSQKLKVGDSGILGEDNLSIIRLQQMASVKYAIAHFNGFGESLPALLGGHIDALFSNAGNFMASTKSGDVRLITVLDKEQSPFFPGVTTAASQGYDISSAASRGVSAPAGTPKEVVDALGVAIGKAIATDEHKKKMTDMGLAVRYMNSAQFSAYWDEVEAWVKPLVELAKKES